MKRKGNRAIVGIFLLLSSLGLYYYNLPKTPEIQYPVSGQTWCLKDSDFGDVLIIKEDCFPPKNTIEIRRETETKFDYRATSLYADCNNFLKVAFPGRCSD